MNIYTPMAHIYAQQTENHERRQAIACETALSNLKTIATCCRMLAVIAVLYLSLGSASAQTLYSGFTPLGEGIPGCYTNNGEYSDKLVDGIRDVAGNKWCVVNGNPDAGTWSATIFTEFKSDAAFIPSSYIMTTGGDTYNYSGRNPTSWKIFGKLNQCDDWTELVSVTNNTSLPIANNESREFSLTNTTTPCRYFRFEVSNIRSGTVFQLAELQFKGTDYSAPPEELCTISYSLVDSYGDGWNGAAIRVMDEDKLLAEWTISSGSTASGTLPVCDGHEIELEWKSGSYDSECSFSITYEDEETIVSGNSNSLPFSFTPNCCSETPILACTGGDLPLGSSRTLSVTGGNGSVTWTASPAGIVSFSSTNGRSTTVTATSPGEVTVTATVAGSGDYCPAVLTCNINVPLPTPTITQANNPLPQCETENAVLTASVDGSVPAGYTFHWYSNSACTTEITSVVSGTNNNTLTISPATAGTIIYCRLEKQEEGTTTDIEEFSCTENVQTYTVPTGATSLKLEVWGAQGGVYSGTPGKGGYSVGTLSLANLGTLSELYVYVGQQGGSSNSAGGWNGGGKSNSWGGSGGGATDIATRSSEWNTDNHYYSRIIVAGGGGGTGYSSCNGGNGGGLSGGNGTDATYLGGDGATQTSAGTNNAGGEGAFGTANTANTNNGGGGGGGWYGGCSGKGGSNDSAGGGGSGYVYSSTTAANYPTGCLLNFNYYLTDASTTGGQNSGNGKAKITATIHTSTTITGPTANIAIQCCGLEAEIQFGDPEP